MNNGNINYNKKVVEMKKITKKFGTFVANDNIDLTVHKGEVHALLGENGAGKSTLMNILYGLYHPTSGEIHINGKLVQMDNPNVAISNGIGMVHQHFMLVQPFTVAQNIILGTEPTKGLGAVDIKKAIEDVKELSEKYGLYVDPNSKIEDITV
ncbi:MAG: ATP-binding cassette domain-containing protein, partial [Cetobacterium sp.]|uniref:ATP-binding cassette domain-containing protein n=1 Tax=Cetobacterium sp. TaxID=2071632 RepID=UPI002FC61A56